MEKEHHYAVSTDWTGNQGEGTKSYRSYSRDHILHVSGKPEIPGSSDPSFRGSPQRYNPEELLIASISACHMLWYLHLCSDQHIVVTTYQDSATGTMIETSDGSGHFKEVVLNPEVTITDQALIEKATQLHDQANRLCFVANSVNFPIRHNPVFKVGPQ